MEVFGYLFLIAIWMIANPLAGIVMYLLPVIFALILRKKNALPIVILTILLGWFFPAWILFFLWSIFGERNNSSSTANWKTKDRPCQFCSKFFPKELDTCPHCGKKQHGYEV